MNPYLKKYGPGGETDPYDPTTSYIRPKKVNVDGKEMSTYSNEYRNLYNTGNLMPVDYDGIPVMYGPEVEVTAKMTDEERERRLRKQYYDPNLTERENEKKYQAKKTIEGWKQADINQPGGLQRGGEAMTFPLKAAGTAVNYLSEILNTPLAAAGEYISGRNDFNSVLPSLSRSMNNAGATGFPGLDKPNPNQQITPGNAIFPNNPYAAMLVDLPADLLISRGGNTIFKQGVKLAPKIINRSLRGVNTDVALDIANRLSVEPNRFNTVDDIQNFIVDANSALDPLPVDVRRVVAEYGDHLMRQNAPEGVNIYDYQDFLSSNMTNPVVMRSFAEKMQNMQRRFPFLDPNVNMSDSEITSILNEARDIVNRGNRHQGGINYGTNRNNPHIQLMNEWGDRERRIIGRYQPDDYQQSFNNVLQNNLNNIQSTRFQLPIRNNTFNVQDFISSLKPKTFISKAKGLIDDLNYTLGKKFYPAKDFDNTNFANEVNKYLQKGLGIKKDDYKISVKQRGNTYEVEVIMPGENTPTRLGNIMLAQTKSAKQKTFTEGLFGNIDKNFRMEKPNDFPYQYQPHLEDANTGIGAEVHKAMSEAIKKQGGMFTSSRYHLDPGLERYLHEAIKKRGAIPLEGFTEKHFKKLDELRSKIGIHGRKADTEKYLKNLPSDERNEIYNMFRNVRWRIPKVAGIGTTGAAAIYGTGQMLKEMKEKKESYKHGGSVKTYTKWVNNNLK